MNTIREYVRHFPSFSALETVCPVTKIVSDLQRHMPRHNVSDYFAQKPWLLAGADDIAVAWEGAPGQGNVLGLISLNGYAVQGECPDFVQISTIHIAEAKQKSLLLKRLIAHAYMGHYRREGRLPTWTVFKTFSPSTYNAFFKFKKMIGDGAMLYPGLVANKPRFAGISVQQVAQNIAARLEPKLVFDGRLGIIRGGGGSVRGSYWHTKPRSSRDEINRFFEQRMTEADRMLCIFALAGESDKSIALRLLDRWADGSLDASRPG